MTIQSQVFCGTWCDRESNQRLLCILLRLFVCSVTGKPFFTWQEIANAFGKKDRRNMQDFMQQFQACEGDFWRYLARKTTKKDAVFPRIEAQILTAPLLTIAEHSRVFCESHTQEQVWEQTFLNYVNEIPTGKLLTGIRQLRFKQGASLDVRRDFQELLNLPLLSRIKRREVVEVFPEGAMPESAPRKKRGEPVMAPTWHAKLLVVLLVACGLSQEILGLLFGGSKTSIHNWMCRVCGKALEGAILQSIVRWSGQVSFDEKWLKIKGVRYFALWAVDAVSGFPLLIDRYPRLETVSWTLFFKRFQAVYGLPKLILSDGSQAVAAAREAVFPRSRYQLCKFHKLRNLMKRLWQQSHDPRLLTRCLRFAKHIFSNRWGSSRNYAAKTLQTLAGEQVASYLEAHILSWWRHLTMSLTSNVSERFNRKIEKCVSARYGVSSVEGAQVFLRALWLKELVMNGQKHLTTTSEVAALDVSRMCQEPITTDRILHFFQTYCPSLVEKLG